MLEKTDFELLVKLSGNKKPNKLFININNNIVPMEAKAMIYIAMSLKTLQIIFYSSYFDKTKSKTLS